MQQHPLMPDIFASLLYALSLVFLTQSVRREEGGSTTMGYNQNYAVAHYLVPIGIIGVVSFKVRWVVYAMAGGAALMVMWVAWKWGKRKLTRTKVQGDGFEDEKEG